MAPSSRTSPWLTRPGGQLRSWAATPGALTRHPAGPGRGQREWHRLLGFRPGGSTRAVLVGRHLRPGRGGVNVQWQVLAAKDARPAVRSGCRIFSTSADQPPGTTMLGRCTSRRLARSRRRRGGRSTGPPASATAIPPRVRRAVGTGDRPPQAGGSTTASARMPGRPSA